MPNVNYRRRKDTKQERWIVYWHIHGKALSLCSDGGHPISSEQQAQKVQKDVIEKYKVAIEYDDLYTKNNGILLIKNRKR